MLLEQGAKIVIYVDGNGRRFQIVDSHWYNVHHAVLGVLPTRLKNTGYTAYSPKMILDCWEKLGVKVSEEVRKEYYLEWGYKV